METTLSKWGNSKAVRVPVEACDELGLSLGDRAEVTVDAEHGVLVLKFERSKRAYARTRRMTMEEFLTGLIDRTVEELIARALEGGGRDNITVICCEVSPTVAVMVAVPAPTAVKNLRRLNGNHQNLKRSSPSIA